MMHYFLFGTVFLFAAIFILPFKALAGFHEIEVKPPQSCGPMCVIETIGFDEKQEALEFALKAGTHTLYQIKDSPLWFVDYQVTEETANSRE